MSNFKKLAVASAVVLGLIVVPKMIRAETTTGEKIQNSADEAQKTVKRKLRKTRRTIRNKTGNADLSKDIEDSVNNASDSVDTAVKKAKRKAD